MKLVSVISICVFICFFLCLNSSCTRDMVEEVESICPEDITYAVHIRPIMNASCAYAGCHAGGAAPGDFTSYEGIAKYIDGGRIALRVTVNQDMPPSNATVGPTMLSESEIEFFKCWVQAGYPEN